jgi:hypothetical protein
MKKRVLIGLVVAVAMVIAVASGVAAYTVNAVYHSHSGMITPTGGTIAQAVALPDDGKFVQLGPGSWIILSFPGHEAAVPDGTAAPDLRVDTYDVPYPADAEVFVSLDRTTWTSVGVYPDTANIDLDLNGAGPVKYVKIDQAGHYIDPAYPTLGFDLDAVVALNAGLLPYGEITSPGVDEVIFGSADFDAVYFDDDPSGVSWAVRRGTCAAATNTVFGNVDGHNDAFSWDGHLFHAIADTSTWTAGSYCFIFNPTEDGSEVDIRLTRWFWVGRLGALQPPVGYNPVDTDHTVSVSIGVPVAGVEVLFQVTGANEISESHATGGNGLASFTYTGANIGIDTINACIDLDDNDSCDPGEPSATATATKTWFEDFVTGGGKINAVGGRKAEWTFGGTVGCLPDVCPVGQFEIVHHTTGVACHFDTFANLVFSGPAAESPPATHDTATFTASGTCSDGSTPTITVTIEDNAEPGTGQDTIAILEWGVSDTINGGNFQVHDIEL